MAQALRDFTEMTTLWRQVARRSSGCDEAEAQVFNQMAVALASRLPQRPHPALEELHALAAAVSDRGFLHEGARAPVTGHQPWDRVTLSADSFAALCRACLSAL